ncbi:hypothetical protein [Aureimonas pseudogalii]|uniref:Uncharacterized protein n=1 Tax=Aureimonas pseudogalii TaxID=1744844 RepID=A0A7W6H628_9HYPH|nr:hypothetical protein [Aureimonas pseudogalii]MBB3999158.1 hypothetical protein [Aureimonas pseudogalii]
MIRPLLTALSLSLAVAAACGSAAAADKDEAFFQTVFGRWTGPGEIVAGKYKGTKFVCDLSGEKPSTDVGMALDGTCRVGMFSQPMSAKFTKGGSSYKGAFLDGSKGKGLDIISGDVDGNRVVVGLDRKQLKGAMVARLVDPDKLNITISVQVADELVPVIGMNLKRDASVKRASLAD